MLIPDTRADIAEGGFPCRQARFLTVNLTVTWILPQMRAYQWDRLPQATHTSLTG